MTSAIEQAPEAHPPATAVPQRPVVGLGLALVGAGGLYLALETGWRLGLLWLIGAGLGIALYHAAFGFTFGFRTFLRSGRSAHVRAQLLMLGLAILIVLPLLEAGSVFGQPVRGFVFAPGLAVALGAFLFGIGMQLGGGCASGTLYTAGGGSTRMALTLLFFVVGATLAAFAAPLWTSLPAPPPISLPATLGLLPALGLQLALFAALWWLLTRYERARHGAVEPIFHGPRTSFLTGPWPYAYAALALALLNALTVVVAGRPWAITTAFALWGSFATDALGIDDPAFWPYWEDPTRVAALYRPLLVDVNTVMIVGLMAGACLAAGLAGRFAPTLRIPLPHLLASIVGGLLLGFGGIVATGCNISAYFSGVASGSLHGWLWLAAALPGNWLGTKLRPAFRLDPPPADR